MLDSVVYGLEVYVQDITSNDFKSIVNALERYRKSFSHISYLCVYSSKDGQMCARMQIKNENPGRPKTVIFGKAVKWHCHIAVTGKHSYSYLEKVKKAINKRFKRKVCKIESKGNEEHAINYVKYCYRQASFYRSYGVFRNMIKNKMLE